MRGFVIGADAVFAHPVQNGCADTVGAVRLDAAVCDRNDRVRFSGEEARDGLSVLLLHGELHLVPIAVDLFRAGDGQGRERLAADACQAIIDVRALEFQFLRIVHMPQRAAAASWKIGTVRLHAVRRRLLHTQQFRKTAERPMCAMRILHTSPGSAPGTNTTCPSTRAIPVPSAVAVSIVTCSVSPRLHSFMAAWNVSRETFIPPSKVHRWSNQWYRDA